jgi:hypothetical protein
LQGSRAARREAKINVTEELRVEAGEDAGAAGRRTVA